MINKINVKVSDNNNKIQISNNKAQYYSEAAKNASDAAAESAVVAKNWATKLNTSVDGVEYSAKYYAEQAALLNVIAKNGLLEQEQVSLDNINFAKAQAMNDINGACNKALTTMNNVLSSILSSINTRGQYWVDRCAENNLFYEEIGDVDITIN